jgi:hypothetical protein
MEDADNNMATKIDEAAAAPKLYFVCFSFNNRATVLFTSARSVKSGNGGERGFSLSPPPSTFVIPAN